MKAQSPVGRFTWVLFVAVAIIFFAAQHELTFSVDRGGDFNSSAEEEITRVDEGSSSRRVAFLSLGLLGVLALEQRPRRRLRIKGVLGVLLVINISWAALSILWADDVALTARRLVVLAMISLGALGIAKACSARAIVWLTLFTSGLYFLIGIGAALVLGTFHPFAEGYRFAGTIHPNHEGINCALLVFSSLAAFHMVPRRRNLALLCGAVGFVFLILTGSRTALVSTSLGVALYWGLVSTKSYKRLVAACVVTVTCAGLAIFGDGVVPVGRRVVLMGRESGASSLEGRVPIWDESLSYAALHPVGGYGYGGFWNPQRMADISASEAWGVAEGHSAYLDVLLETGAVGLFTFVLVLLAGFQRSLAYYRDTREPRFAFYSALLLFCLLDGVLESATVDATLLSFLATLALFKLGFRWNVAVVNWNTEKSTMLIPASRTIRTPQ